MITVNGFNSKTGLTQTRVASEGNSAQSRIIHLKTYGYVIYGHVRAGFAKTESSRCVDYRKSILTDAAGLMSDNKPPFFTHMITLKSGTGSTVDS